MASAGALARHAEATGAPHPKEIPVSRRATEIARTHHGRPEWLRAVVDHVTGLTDREAEALRAELG